MTVTRTFALGLIFAIIATSPAIAKQDRTFPTVSEHHGELMRLWHEAGMAYTRNDISAARDTYRILLRQSALQHTETSAWYVMSANFGIARTSSRLRDTSETRVALLHA